MTVSFVLNGRAISTAVPANRRLIDVLRDDLDLTGTKEGCGIGECGACTVLMNGETVNSCLILARQVEGAELITIEGIAKHGTLHPLQENFLKSGAVQCGFCTPGMVLSTYALLQTNSQPSEQDIATAISGNLCRCTGYKQIIEAVQKTVEEMNTASPENGRS